MTKKYYIYKIINTLNNKVYIGQTIQPKRRWSDHKYNARHQKTNQYIHRAMNKYGVDNFTFEIIEEFISLEDCNIAEAKYIEKHKTRNKKFGYNIKPGGHKKGWKHSEETKKKLSKSWKEVHGEDGVAAAHEALRGRKLSKKHIESIKRANTGNKRLVGHKQSQETIDKRIKAIADKYGSKVCNAPGCERTDGYKHKDVRYCEKHVQRVIKYGTHEGKK